MKNIKTFVLLSLLLFASQAFSQQMSLKDILAKNARPVVEAYRDENTGLYGYMNTKTNELVVPCKYQFAIALAEGLGAVNIGGKVIFDDMYAMDYVCKGGKWGYIDTTGAVIIPIKYESADAFSEGFAAVELKGKKALIDKTGKVLTEFKYDYIYPFTEGLAVVGRGKPLKFTFIDKTGKEILPCDLDEANSFFQGKAKVIRYGATYFINSKGERLR